MAMAGAHAVVKNAVSPRNHGVGSRVLRRAGLASDGPRDSASNSNPWCSVGGFSVRYAVRDCRALSVFTEQRW